MRLLHYSYYLHVIAFGGLHHIDQRLLFRVQIQCGLSGILVALSRLVVTRVAWLDVVAARCLGCVVITTGVVLTLLICIWCLSGLGSVVLTWCLWLLPRALLLGLLPGWVVVLSGRVWVGSLGLLVGLGLVVGAVPLPLGGAS